MPDKAGTAKTGFIRDLGLWDSTMIVAGSMIGSGIFIVSAEISRQVGSAGGLLATWIITGLLTITAALSYGELAAMMPAAGGQYVYLREAYSPLWGFLYGWTALLVINPASIAAIAVAFARYVGFFTPLSEPAIRVIAVLSIFALTLLNARGVRLGATTQNILTFAKIGALVVMVGAAFLLPGGSTANLSQLWPPGTMASWIGPFGVAMVAVLWAYDGWIETTYVGGEIQDPGRNLPRSIILSTLIVVALYTVVSFAFAYVLSPARMAGSKVVASDAAAVVLGGGGAAFVAVAILMSTLGSNNGQILAGPRIPYAMARGGLFFRSQALVHSRYATPVVALLTQAVIASVLAASGTYNTLFTYVVFASFLFYGLSAAAVIRLRRRAPALARPYRAWGYPLTPLIFIAFAAWLVVSTVIATPRDSAVGAGLILLGLPGYYYWRRAGAGRGGL